MRRLSARLEANSCQLSAVSLNRQPAATSSWGLMVNDWLDWQRRGWGKEQDGWNQVGFGQA
jgi:hypothetical protein